MSREAIVILVIGLMCQFACHIEGHEIRMTMFVTLRGMHRMFSFKVIRITKVFCSLPLYSQGRVVQ